VARGKKSKNAGTELPISDYRYDITRKNNPPAKIAAEGHLPLVPKIQYRYSPRLDPVLRSDLTGQADQLPELLEAARNRPLTDEEARLLTEALRHQQPWLEWAGKHEALALIVDPVALHIHERISAQAILKVAARQDVTRDLFADPQQDYRQAVQFYQHDINWANRMILGDSLQVMASLAHREDLAGKVQMIYLDPPYGIKFGSNFQPEIGKREVKDKESDLIREPEMVKAYRDTWTLGVHSYLAYLRDRLIVAKELLTDSGSIFVQISDENLHRVRMVMDEVFGVENCAGVLTFRKTSGLTADRLAQNSDYLLWYGRDIDKIKFKQFFVDKGIDSDLGFYKYVCLSSGEKFALYSGDSSLKNQKINVYSVGDLTSSHFYNEGMLPFSFQDKFFKPGARFWSTSIVGLNRLAKADRIHQSTNSIRFIRYFDDFPVQPLTANWTDTVTGQYQDNRIYVVQTAEKVIGRCLLMTTDPGDLVLDPTCGSGTTAQVAEAWGRRWIAIDTSRVALAIARQRLMTAKFDYYPLKNEAEGLSGGFNYKTVPHITLKSIAQNTQLDPIFARHEPILEARLADLNNALAQVSDDIRRKLAGKLLTKQKTDGKRAITDADTRRWQLPPSLPKGAGSGFQHWTVPFDTDPDYPQILADAVTAYRTAWRAKMDEVNACIADNAEQEELVDQPQIQRGIVRVSGPFTVEAVQPPEISLGASPAPLEGNFDGEPDALDTGFAAPGDGEIAARNAEAYLDHMLRLLKMDGIRFPNNRQMAFTRLEPVLGKSDVLHAEGRWTVKGEADPDPDGSATVCVAFGPQCGPVTARQVEMLIRAASRRGYDDLVIAGFNFDGPAQAVIEEADNPNVRIHIAHIRPDINPGMTGLLKEQPGSQLFTVFGQPRTRLNGPDPSGEYTVTMEGVDIYNPVDNTVTPTKADKVAAWFLDSDYDGRTFCITQAFFPDKSAWDKLAKALGNVIDAERFAALSGTESLPFLIGENRTVAVKVIDPRGNEVMQVHRLEGRL